MHRPSETLADSKVTCLVYMTHVWYSLGYSEQAHQYIEEALRWARELAHSYSVVLTRHFGAALFQLLRDYNEAEWWATRETVQSDEIPRALWYAGGIIQEGWARVMRGKVEEGLIRMHEGMQHWSLTNASLALARWHALLAEAYGKSGQPERGLAELEKARIVMEQTGDRHYEAEVYRMMGVLELQLPNPEESQAERWFEKALEVARRQQAKSLELRTAIDQSKFWQRQGKREEAYTLLAPIYGWFTEGFDTADLQEAKTLLETLAS
jgi:predicted ATPase